MDYRDMRLLIISSFISLSNQVFQYFDLGILFTTSFLDDLLFFPIILSIILIYENRKKKNYEIPTKHTLIGVLIISVLFEIIIPKIDKRFIADYVDVLFYIIGAMIYHLTRLKKRSIAKVIGHLMEKSSLIISTIK